MSKIKILDETTAGKIAAGEVIERPAGVLKELLENALDSGATSISVDIEDAGKKLIRVSDNGGGMAEEDLLLALKRHSTSKIKDFSDLESLNTFGFRGEALYSVAAVSEITIRSSEGNEGKSISSSGGGAVTLAPAPAIKGTTVEVKNLFFNTPARQRFLKSDPHERSLLLRTVEEAALANLDVAFAVKTDGRAVLNTPVTKGTFEERVRARAEIILGRETAKNLLFLADDSFNFRVFITPPDALVSVRDLQFAFINKRPVSSKTLQQAVYKAFQGARGKDKHPVFIIYMELDPADFDVNIHPQKKDIRFVRENAVFGFIMNFISKNLFRAGTLEMPLSPAEEPPREAPVLPPSPSFAPRAQQEDLLSGPVRTPAFAVRDFEENETYSAAAALPAGEEAPAQNAPAWWRGEYRFLGALHKTFLIYETERGLTLMDQHAARERVLYEKYLKELAENSVEVQPLLIPENVDLPASGVESLLDWKEWLAKAGFEIEMFSRGTVAVKTMPNVLPFKEGELKEFIISLSSVLGDPLKSDEELKRKTIARLACKRAVKAKENMSSAEAMRLLDDLKECEGPYCPHGRPVLFEISASDIARKLGR